ncbi:MAG: hypothetical protein MRK02_04620 [Candidatus Scalindua sp.]|nr:hypothetical protein [Candidatus Scalindua sp.]
MKMSAIYILTLSCFLLAFLGNPGNFYHVPLSEGAELCADDEIPREKNTGEIYDITGKPLVRNSPGGYNTFTLPEFHGNTVYLTIHEPLQSIAESELATLISEHRPKYAWAVMADPKTGAILAMVQQSHADEDSGKNTPGRYRNHMVEDTFEPAQLMMPVIVCGALDSGVVSLTSPVRNDYQSKTCLSSDIMIGQFEVPDSELKKQSMPVWQIVQKSENIGIAHLARVMGNGRMYQTLEHFGIGEPTGIGLPAESTGEFRPIDNLNHTVSVALGYDYTMTCIQVVQAYCALANRGEMMQLHLVDRVVDSRNGETLFTGKPNVKRVVAGEKAVTDAVEALKKAVTPEGTASEAMIEGFEVCGKTGTAQKLGEGYPRRYGSHGYIASIIGFVPADDPAFVLCIIADKPGGEFCYGGTVCAPTFRKIAEQSLRYLNVSPGMRAYND